MYRYSIGHAEVAPGEAIREDIADQCQAKQPDRPQLSTENTEYRHNQRNFQFHNVGILTVLTDELILI